MEELMEVSLHDVVNGNSADMMMPVMYCRKRN